MADDKKEDAPPDPERINTHDEAHMVYWSKKWKVSREELGNAVYKTGGRLQDVKRELGK
jgi:hypothetical protein